jgi:uncharacterized protein (DUF1697 family)
VTTRIGFLRAVNLGRRTVSMAKLIDVCEGLGFGEPWTFVNSGNVVFEATGKRDAIEGTMERALEAEFGFECTTFVRSAAQLRAALAVRPFTMSAGDTYFITFLKSPPAAPVARGLEQASNGFDTLVVHGRDVHWHMRGKSTDTQVKAVVWRSLGEHASTSRNVTMLTKLAAKIDA